MLAVAKTRGTAVRLITIGVFAVLTAVVALGAPKATIAVWAIASGQVVLVGWLVVVMVSTMFEPSDPFGRSRDAKSIKTRDRVEVLSATMVKLSIGTCALSCTVLIMNLVQLFS